MLNNINKTDLFYDYYAQWITVYKEGAIRKVTMDKYLLKKGSLSCYINTAGDERPKYKVSDKSITGYRHFGRLVLTLRNYEV